MGEHVGIVYLRGLMASRPTVAIDFDGTLVAGNEMLPGAKDALRKLHDAGFYIIIHSCNNPEWIRLVLNNNDVFYDYIWEDKGKPVAHWYIDDRGVRYDSDWSKTLAELGVTNASTE